MTLKIEVPKSIEDRLIQKANEAGLDLAHYVEQVIHADAARPSLKELSGSLHQQFLDSGMTDDELGDFLERAKHEMRAERFIKIP